MEQQTPTAAEKAEALKKYNEARKAAHDAQQAILATAKQIAEELGGQHLLEDVYFYLHHPKETPETRHCKWMEDRLEQGWMYAPTKDIEAQMHPLLVPYSELIDDIKANNEKLIEAVNKVVPRTN